MSDPDTVSRHLRNGVAWLGIPLDYAQTRPWRIDLRGTPRGGRTPVRLVDVAFHVSNPDGQCDYDVTGSVDGTLQESDQTLRLVPPADDAALVVTGVSGCFGLIDEDDSYAITATYAITHQIGPLHVTAS